jgi:hypothetical protein
MVARGIGGTNVKLGAQKWPFGVIGNPQIQADIDAGSIPPARHLIIDLWRRVEELQAHIDELERQMKEKTSN